MLKKTLIISLLFSVFLAGCSQQRQSGAARLDTPTGMVRYLEGQRLPALKSAELWESEFGTGLKLTTSHYEVYTTLLEPLMLSQVPGFVESCYRGYNRQLPQPVETQSKFRVYLFAERSQWEDFTKSFAGAHSDLYLKIKKGAYYLKGACVTYNIGRERTFSVLGHEGWHQFNKRFFKFRMPSWLDEGIAMQFENTRYDKGLFYFEPALNLYRLGALKKTLLINKMIPLGELIGMNPGEALVTADSDDTVAAFYGQSYALVRFLREDDYGKRLGKYHGLMMDGLEGRWPLSDADRKIAFDRNIPQTVPWNRSVGSMLFEKYIGEDIDRIEKEYLAFCRKIVYHVHFKK